MGSSTSAGSDIVLVFCPPWETQVPPLGIAYLCSTLRSHGFNVQALDLNLKLFRAADAELKGLWKMDRCPLWADPRRSQELIGRLETVLSGYLTTILESGAPTIGFSVHSGNIFASLEVAKRIKAIDRSRSIVFGGPGVFSINARNRQMSLEIAEPSHYREVDFFVLGDGEERLRWLLEKREEMPPGVVEQPEQLIRGLRSRIPLPKLQQIPFPTFEEFDLSEYAPAYLPVLASRGCICRCRFCNDCYINPSFRSVPPAQVAEAISFYLGAYGVRCFCFNDLLINGNLQHLEQLCSLLIEDRLDVEWWGQAVIRRDMSYRSFEALRRAGCSSLVFGVESFSDTVLEKMNKPYTVEDSLEVLKRCDRAGIPPGINLIVGFPGEGEQEFDETCRFLEDHPDSFSRVASLTPCYLNAGSDLFSMAASLGITYPKGDEPHLKWSIPGSNDLAIREDRIRRLAALLKKLGKTVDYLAPTGC
jgi:hypothetical protein